MVEVAPPSLCAILDNFDWATNALASPEHCVTPIKACKGKAHSQEKASQQLATQSTQLLPVAKIQQSNCA